MDDKAHPTIKEIYSKVHLLDPVIGQATVYRNVNKLVARGRIKKININNNIDRYDGDLSNHYHFICTCCNKIIDIPAIESNELMEKIMKNAELTLENYDIILYGKCQNCSK